MKHKYTLVSCLVFFIYRLCTALKIVCYYSVPSPFLQNKNIYIYIYKFRRTALLKVRNEWTENFVTRIQRHIVTRLGICDEIMPSLFRSLILCSVDVK
jgi:hypothetical protein